jgi:hypothetical protein
MMPASIRQLRLTGRARAVLAVGAALVVISVVVGIWIWTQGAQKRAISRLPADERAEIYRREIETLHRLCGRGPRSDALKEECERRATFVLEFPECDPNCKALARSHLPSATR